MTAAEYADLALASRTKFADNVRLAMPTETEIETRKITAGSVDEETWCGSLVNRDTGKVRILIIQITSRQAAEQERTAGARNFKPGYTISFDLFHDYVLGTDAVNSQADFDRDADLLQYAIETSRSLAPTRSIVERYSITSGHRGSTIRPLHWAHAEATVEFFEIRYEPAS